MTRAIEELGILFLSRIRPAVRSQGAGESNTPNEGPAGASRTPRPARSPLDGQVVHAHSNVGEEDSDDSAADDIESVMPEVEPPRRCDEEGYCGWEESQDHQQHGRCCAARANRGALVAIIIPFDGELRQVGESNGEFGSEPEGQIAESGERDWINVELAIILPPC